MSIFFFPSFVSLKSVKNKNFNIYMIISDFKSNLKFLFVSLYEFIVSLFI